MKTKHQYIKSSYLFSSLTLATLFAFASALDLMAQDRFASAIRPYKDIITKDTKTSSGLFKVHAVGGRYIFELPDALINRDLLVVNRITKSAAGKRLDLLGFAGDMISQKVIRFTKGPQDKIFMEQITYEERSADSTSNGMYSSVKNSNLQPMIASFPVKAYHTDSIAKTNSVLIDMTDYLNNDNEVFYFSSIARKSLSLNGPQTDRSYIKEIKAYPENVEIRTLRTYGRMVYGSSDADLAQVAAFELNSSIVLLPAIPMKPRYSDSRIGYLSTSYTDFDANPHGVQKVSMINRFRLEPKEEDISKYKKGLLVEPKKQIVFYIDPATPKKWIPYLIKGVNVWSAAFEQAGFKNAVVGKEAPKDSTWSIDDARHNAIIYKPSSITNAFGLHIHDPRSGEILESHITFHHSMMKGLQSWYMLQAGAVDPEARKMVLSDELMGTLISYIATHEVGHSLGLAHNFGSSATVPVEMLRNKQFLEKNGHTPSIMDYARFNYVAQPEDQLSRAELLPRIGEYDKWAIEWGYRWMPEQKTAEDEIAPLNKLTTDRLTKNNRLWFGGEFEFNNPRIQAEDLGDNAMLAGTYGIKNLKRILPQLRNWTETPGQGYDNLLSIYNDLFKQYMGYMYNATRNIGGVYHTEKTVGQAGPVNEAVPYAVQKEAVTFLNAQLFTAPLWLEDAEVKAKTDLDVVQAIKTGQATILKRLLDTRAAGKLNSFNTADQLRNYTFEDLLKDLKSGIWSNLTTHEDTDHYKRTLQKIYVEQIIALSNAKDISTTDLVTTVQDHIKLLKVEIDKEIPLAKGVNASHLRYLSAQIENAPKSDGGSNGNSMPPRMDMASGN